MALPERSDERDAAIEAILPLVADHGWTIVALSRLHAQPDDLSMLFPGGALDLIEAYCDLADRQMQADAAGQDAAGKGLTARVRHVVALRFARQRPYRDAIRRALGVLALPANVGASLRITLRTVDSIWAAAGDRSADFSWYTKRAILGGVYGTTLLYWLRDYGEDDTATLAFLDRRLAGVGRLGKTRARLGRAVAQFRPHSEMQI